MNFFLRLMMSFVLRLMMTNDELYSTTDDELARYAAFTGGAPLSHAELAKIAGTKPLFLPILLLLYYSQA